MERWSNEVARRMLGQEAAKRNARKGTKKHTLVRPIEETFKKVIIGIDPDLHKNGFAAYYPMEHKVLAYEEISLFDVEERIKALYDEHGLGGLHIRLEMPTPNAAYGAGKAIRKEEDRWNQTYKSGQARAIGLKLEELIRRFGRIPLEIVHAQHRTEMTKQLKRTDKQAVWIDKTLKFKARSGDFVFFPSKLPQVCMEVLFNKLDGFNEGRKKWYGRKEAIDALLLATPELLYAKFLEDKRPR